MDVLDSRMALAVGALSDHKNTNFEATTSMTEMDLSSGTGNSCAETMRIWKKQNRNFVVARIKCATVTYHLTGILKLKVN